MNEFKANGMVRDVGNEHYIGYLIENNEVFYNTEFQIIQKDTGNDFVKCYRSVQNGHIKLIYDIEGYRLFSSIVNTLNENQFFQLLYKYIFSLEKIKKNGFISLQNIDESVNKIFVDMKTLSIKFICVPVNVHEQWQSQSLNERELLNTMAYIIEQSVHINNYYVFQMLEDCRNQQILLDDIYNFMCLGKYGDWQNVIGNTYPDNMYGMQGIRLCGEKESYGNEIIINKSGFLIGKDAAQCNYAIKGSNNVSRKHCIISQEYDRWYIEDLESTNGTYLNDVRIRSGQKMPINAGDKIAIADMHYIVG